MSITVSRTAEPLDSLAADWDRLSGEHPFSGWDWMRAWWAHYGDDVELFVLVGRAPEGGVVGLAPWIMERSLAGGAQIRPLGSGEVCSDYVSLLVEPQHRAAFAAAAADWLVAAARGAEARNRWDGIDLDAVLDSDDALAAFRRRLEQSSLTVATRPGPRCWRIALPESWDEYVAILSKSHRKQVRRAERRLDSGQAVLYTAQSPGDLEHGMAVLVDLHQRRRQSLGEPGCFASRRFSEFVHDVARRLLAHGELRLQWMELDGQPVAAEFQLARGRSRYAYQAGIDPDRLEVEPGRLIHVATIRQAIGEGHTYFDFLRGDEPYKAHWRAQPSATTRWRIASNRALAQFRHNLWIAGAAMKDTLSGRGAASPSCE